MSKKIIAVDVDDVLAKEAEFVIAYSNRVWGHTLSLDDYSEDWTQLWQVDRVETERRVQELHKPGIVSSYELLEDGHEVLKTLTKKYKLIIITSRRSRVKSETLKWLQENFGDVFDEVHFSGIYEGSREGAHLLTKTDLCVELGVNYLIDDQPKHCFGAAGAGIDALLYGDYAVSRDLELPARVTRCKDWQAVKEYFDGRD